MMVPVLGQGEYAERAAKLAATAGLPNQASVEDRFQLQLDAEGLALHWCGESVAPLRIDFSHGKAAYRAQHTSWRNEALAKAVGVKQGKRPVVLDLTAGLARDAFMLASVGCPIYLAERHPVVRLLLADGIQRGQQLDSEVGEACRRMLLLPLRDVTLQQQLMQQHFGIADVAYADPMYPKTGKRKAQVKKDMQMFQQLVGEDNDADQLMPLAEQYGCQRIVVKRPGDAPNLDQRQPNYVLGSKKHRFDIYLRNSND
ncbi:16S rRNA methyltransferase [Idiomarina tyrosinivorans]|uniref:Ribosomal RNA small subunit methyltransferase J n=1 Tax=Idiomarina tyrosinivorans TaxID=1445662 RepID=A0A432ZPZ7_9GAMM|nr:class I SAM-dependent methyltransferase [Idiomarina tyrosinivorans]RUO79908.1 16S rRNA methyltransferase [Idiomarina tyrosinivorans]